MCNSPHAVSHISGDIVTGQKNTAYTYDANGNMTAGDDRSLVYSSFNKPTQITKNSTTNTLHYGPERQLIQEQEPTNTGTKTTTYFGGSYEKIHDGFDTTHRYHISTANGGTIAVIIDKDSAPKPVTHYLHRDHLDSIVAISNEHGFIMERFFYDAFGKRRTAVGQQLQLEATNINVKVTDRGFTGHKLLDNSDLIHMKGRVYDPEIGKFLSADPHIQFAGNLQSYNRYSYVLNNPLAFTDPSGYFLSKIFKAIKKLFKKIAKIIKKVIKAIKKVVEFVKEYYKVIIAVVITVAAFATGQIWMAKYSWAVMTTTAGTVTGLSALGAAAVGAIAGGISGLITTGSLTGALKGAITGAAFGYIGGSFGEMANANISAANSAGQSLKAAGLISKGAFQGLRASQAFMQSAIHGAVGGLSAKMNGFSFSKGVLTGFLNKASSVFNYSSNIVISSFQHGIVSGFVRDIAGGSFSRGFEQGFIATLANEGSQELSKELRDRFLAGAAAVEATAANADKITGGDGDAVKKIMNAGKVIGKVSGPASLGSTVKDYADGDQGAVKTILDSAVDITPMLRPNPIIIAGSAAYGILDVFVAPQVEQGIDIISNEISRANNLSDEQFMEEMGF